MPRNEANEMESNEFELVLGNKQLLSVFFIVIMLLTVFFTMGYTLGRNSAPVDAAKRIEQPYERQNATSAMPSSASTKREVVVEPSREEPKPVEAASKAEQAPQKPIEIPAVTVTQPAAGQTYLQVLAVAKAEADVLAEVLAKKGFRALVAPGPNDKVYRVLVGPAKDANDAGKLKTDLEAAGFKPFIKKY
jgi:cell division septation protein DedD